MGYLTNFIVYTLAMVGVIVVALLIFKNATNVSPKGGAKFLRVVDTLSLGPRKTLYIVSAGEEKFLIAGDVDKTSLISKLETKNNCEEKISAIMQSENEDFSTKSFQETLYSYPQKSRYIDRQNLGIKTSQMNIVNTEKIKSEAVMKKLATKIKG